MIRAHVGRDLLLVLFLCLIVVYSKPVPKEKEKEKNDEEWKKEEDPSYVKYLKQVIEILEEDEHFSKKLENVTEEDIRSGRIAEEIDFANHNVRTKLDELKRKEIEFQRQLLRKKLDMKNGIHREYWNPLNDRENPNTFEVEDLKRLLAKHHEEMEEIDKKRREEFKKHEMEKEHKRRLEEKNFDEAKRKMAEEERKKLRQKHIEDAKTVNHPGSKSQFQEVWEEEDGLEKDQFNSRTFFRLHDKNGDGYLDPMELEALFVHEASKIHNKSDPDFDQRELDEEVQRMREHVVKQVDKDKDNFVSYDEFVGATEEKDYEKPEEGWKGIDEDEEYTDDELAEYEKQFGDYDATENLTPHEGDPSLEEAVPVAHSPDQAKQQDGTTAQHIPMAHNQEQEKQEHPQQQLHDQQQQQSQHH